MKNEPAIIFFSTLAVLIAAHTAAHFGVNPWIIISLGLDAAVLVIFLGFLGLVAQLLLICTGYGKARLPRPLRWFL